MNLLPKFYTQYLETQLKRAEFLILSMLVVMLQQYRSVKLEELAGQFPQKILFESRRKKLQRFLSLPHLTVEKIWWPLFSYWLTNNFESTSVLYIAIDRTQWGLINLIVVSLIYEKRAIPIYFEILPKLGNTNSSKQIAVLSKVLPLLKNYQKVVLGDREFCAVDLAQWLRSQAQTWFCLRLRRNEYIKSADLVWVQLQNLGVIPGISIYLEGVKLTKSKGFVQANIAAKWKHNYRCRSAEEAWFILTNFSNLKMALSAYQKRFGIEEMFRDYKKGGYNLELTGVTGDRLIALIILITLAYTSAIMSGEKIKNKGVVKYVGRVKEKRRTQRRHSNFYIGIHGYSWVESLTFFHELTAQLMSLSPHKRPYYQRGRRAKMLIQSTFEL
ncbi:IS4 family transposase [Argonema galeatum]|uniref:IS4 family transposase n=1 Tax=Argonema galeatum TaxID=2942762 RepID=UPI002011E976|nr:IS4 family transposase [Argonema galeatum]MCL1463883.1 IS4 family transposase [Argonema galeatum A003/A1]